MEPKNVFRIWLVWVCTTLIRRALSNVYHLIVSIHNFKSHQINIFQLSNNIIMKIQAIVLLMAATVSAWVSIILQESISRD